MLMQDPAYQQYTLNEVLGGGDTVGGHFLMYDSIYIKDCTYEKPPTVLPL